MIAKKSSWRNTVFMSRFCLKIIEEGTEISLGILMPALQEHFRSSSAVTGLLLSLNISLWYVAAPLAKLMLDRCAYPRALTTICGLLAGLAMIGTAFTQNLFILGALLISSALCASVLHRQAPILLHQYFPTNYAFISISTFFGAIIGSLIVPMMISLSLMAYGVSGALLVLGGVYANMLPVGYALKVPSDRGGSSVPLGVSGSGGDGGGVADDAGGSGYLKDTTPLISKRKKDIVEGGTGGGKPIRGPNSHRPDLLNGITKENCTAKAKIKQLNCEIESIETGEDTDSDIGCHGGDGPCHHGNNDITESNEGRTCSMRAIGSGDHMETFPHSASEVKADQSYFTRLIKEVTHFDFLVLNPLVYCTLIPSVGIFFVVIGGWDLFEVTYGISQGLEPRTANFIPFASVTGCAVSNCVLIVILRYKPKYCVFLFFFSCCWSTIGFFMITLYSSFVYLMVMSLFIGIGVNGVIVTCEGVIDFVVDEEYFAEATTITDLSIGLGLLVSGLVAGYINDTSGSMKTVYWTLGGINLVACLLMTVLVSKLLCRGSQKN